MSLASDSEQLLDRSLLALGQFTGLLLLLLLLQHFGQSAEVSTSVANGTLVCLVSAYLLARHAHHFSLDEIFLEETRACRASLIHADQLLAL